MAWNEKRLGPYPFDSLGILVVDSESGMETQTMITLGDTAYTLSPEVIEHELTHQWYGNLVSPTDWRDVWMNEGMTMFIQGAYEADQDGISIDAKLDSWALQEQQSRRISGPPGRFDSEEFGESLAPGVCPGQCYPPGVFRLA
jgi:aminopeptidase N